MSKQKIEKKQKTYSDFWNFKIKQAENESYRQWRENRTCVLKAAFRKAQNRVYRASVKEERARNAYAKFPYSKWLYKRLLKRQADAFAAHGEYLIALESYRDMDESLTREQYEAWVKEQGTKNNE